MKNNILKIIIVFVLCFGIKAQAQNVITEYNSKISSLSATEANKLEYLVNGAPTSMFITYDNEMKVHYGETEKIVEMSVEKSGDIVKLASFFEDKIQDITLINLNWDGEEQFFITKEVLEKMRSLKYIYIRCNESLNADVIQIKFRDLLELLNNYSNVEVLYYTMEQAS